MVPDSREWHRESGQSFSLSPDLPAGHNKNPVCMLPQQTAVVPAAKSPVF